METNCLPTFYSFKKDIIYYICLEINISFTFFLAFELIYSFEFLLCHNSDFNYLLIVVGRPIDDETLTRRTAGFFPTLSTKCGEPLLLSINDSPALK